MFVSWLSPWSRRTFFQNFPQFSNRSPLPLAARVAVTIRAVCGVLFSACCSAHWQRRGGLVRWGPRHGQDAHGRPETRSRFLVRSRALSRNESTAHKENPVNLTLSHALHRHVSSVGYSFRGIPFHVQAHRVPRRVRVLSGELPALRRRGGRRPARGPGLVAALARGPRGSWRARDAAGHGGGTPGNSKQEPGWARRSPIGLVARPRGPSVAWLVRAYPGVSMRFLFDRAASLFVSRRMTQGISATAIPSETCVVCAGRAGIARR